MTEDKYIEKRKELEDAFKKQLRSFDVAYSKSIQKYQIGDVIGDKCYKIVITNVAHRKGWGSESIVEPQYRGPALTLKGVPRKDGTECFVRQSDVIYHKPKDQK